MDNRNLSTQELETLRRKAVEAVIVHGIEKSKVCKIFGFTRNSLRKYLKEYHSKGEESFKYAKRGVKLRTRSKITEKQEADLILAITTKTPDELGMEYTLWNSRAIHDYMKSILGVNYNRRTVRKIMTKLGFSSQKPIKLAYERDPKKIEKWLNETYPKIKSRASVEGARIYWGDEMGIQSTDNRGRSYGLKGKKPVIKKSGSRFKCNMLAAITPQGNMNWTVFENNFDAKKCIDFLRRLIKQAKQKVFLILDNHRVHHSKKVKAYIEKYKDKIQIFYLPPYCPDMNPQELLNQDVKANANHFKPLTSLKNLTINVRYYLTKVQFDEFKIMGFFKKKEVAYAA